MGGLTDLTEEISEGFLAMQRETEKRGGTERGQRKCRLTERGNQTTPWRKPSPIPGAGKFLVEEAGGD